MHNSLDRLISIKKEVKTKNANCNIIAVSKTFPIKEILPLINYGHLHFGENKIQEAIEKWTDIKKDFQEIKLHMIGKLQTNKVKFAISLFDYIHSLDNLKLAEKISKEQAKQKKNLKIFIQINIGKEIQKSGISPDELENFYKICKDKMSLNIIGIMCLPPKNLDEKKYFSEMLNLSKKINLPNLSMGMSGDYLNALEYGSTFIRVGSKIFGERS